MTQTFGRGALVWHTDWHTDWSPGRILYYPAG